MNQYQPYYRRIKRTFQLKEKDLTSVNSVIEKYQFCLDAYLMALYSSTFLNQSLDNISNVNYLELFSLLAEKYQFEFDISNSLKHEQFDELNRLLVEVIDYFEFNEKGIDKLSNEIKWLAYDEITIDFPGYGEKKNYYFQKYNGKEDEFFSLLRNKLNSNRPKNIEFKEQLTRLFHKYRPDKINIIDSLLLAYKGKEIDLIESLNLKFEQEDLNKTKLVEIEEKNPFEKIETTQQINENFIEENSDRTQVVDSKENNHSDNNLEFEPQENGLNKEVEITIIKEKEEFNNIEVNKLPTLDSKSEKPIEEIQNKDENQIVFYKWKGIEVPEFSAKNLNEALMKASNFADQLPLYNNKKIFKWGEKIHFYKDDIKFEKPKKEKTKRQLHFNRKLFVPAFSILVLALIVSSIFIFDLSIPFINQKEEVNEKIAEDLNEKKVSNKILENKKGTTDIQKDKVQIEEKIIEEKNENSTDPIDNFEKESDDKLELEVKKSSKIPNVKNENLRSSVQSNNQSANLSNISNKEFFLIAGTFTNELNAEKFLNSLKDKGYSPINLGLIDGYYKIAYAKFNDLNEAQTELENYRNKGVKAWILK